MFLKLDESWKEILNEYFKSKDYFKLKDFLEKEYSEKNLKNKKEIFPKKEEIFTAYNLTPVSKVKVIIVGQDPYHTPNIAHGLSFSVRKGNKIPPSIKNIYKEIESDIKIKKDFNNADLTKWAEQGVLLINKVLTVQAHLPGSHWNKGWEKFTEEIIKKLSLKKENLVFILWGKNAQELEKNIENKEKHLILKSSHPSPFSAYRGFFGNKHFSKTNKYLNENNIKEIDW